MTPSSGDELVGRWWISGVRRLHWGQVLILWILLLGLGIGAGFVALLLSGNANTVAMHSQEARRDSVARTKLPGTAMDDSILVRRKAGNSDYAIEYYLTDTLGLRDTTFRAPSQADRRLAKIGGIVAWPFVVAMFAAVPALLCLTWIWLGGRRKLSD